jgi:uncharacterized protein (DUF2126 family)/transglutaminase-like putative cysteine protease
MANLVRLTHSTYYRYDRPVSMGPHLIRLRPTPQSRTWVPSYALRVEPEPHFLNWIQDPYGNHMARVLFPELVDHFTIHVELTADLTVYNPFDFFLEPEAENWPFSMPPDLARDLAPYVLQASDPPGPLLADFMTRLPPTPAQTVPFLVSVNAMVQQAIGYNIRMEPTIQSPEETLALGRGSCRDSALLLVEVLRRLGFAARFVSGYLIQLVPDVRPLSGAMGPDRDFTDLHAWAEVYVPGAGWIGLDATSGLLAGEGHIPLASAPRPSTAAPVEGVLDPCEVSFDHVMSVTRLADDPRATRPFPDGGAEGLDAVGLAVDQRLAALGYTLTIGGEPTFVSEEHREDEEWNGAAIGPRKKEMARDLLHRLRERWAPGGLIHVSQGKWYPGESLPRWAFSCWWRRDGAPVWQDGALLADESVDRGFTHTDASRFIHALVSVLGVEERFIIPAYEDPLHVLITERDLPINLEPGDPRLNRNEDRRRLARALSTGVDTPTGFVLPLAKGSWKSGPWPTRAGRLVLIPGDSPVGLRLPIDSLPWADEDEDVDWYPEDSFSVGGGRFAAGRVPGRRSGRGAGGGSTRNPRGAASAYPPLTVTSYDPGAAERDQTIQEQSLPESDPPLAPGESAAWIVRTALTVQPRDGNIYVFLPPMRTANDWFELVAEIERAASISEIPIVLEGYTPPPDPSVGSFHITPDPGVIEVNIAPSRDWLSFKGIIDDLWTAARDAGLSTVKYLVGGQEVATGGGCHWVLGGPTPAESPFLRRPDLLRSWITYLNHHPALSYLFAGLFVGPTCQAPRPDEANPSLIPDIELAFEELDKQETVAPWLADRLFRNLLVDGSGNTHRTELCIDKLYAPDRSNGRLGLVEFRAFEMAVHRDTALSQALLLRALTVMFLEAPIHEPLVRWGSELRDRWMLPAHLQHDLDAVLADLDRVGLSLPREPFAAHLDFRFPRVGAFGIGEMTVELRNALEPWPVLGEEGSSGGTVRFVDSSVERLEIRVLNGDLQRYAILCEGRVVPLAPVEGGKDTLVGGVRFKAWELESSLHPTVPATPQLGFQIFDRFSGTVVDGCTYSVDHPAGRNYETPPVNEFEAESRRNARFRRDGRALPPIVVVPELAIDSEYVHTLDLRR